MIANNKLGKYDEQSGFYDGVIGDLQRNKTQLIAIPQHYPLIDPERKYFEYSWPINEDQMMIASVYDSAYNKMLTDVTAMFTSVNPELWYIVLAVYFIFIILLKMSFWIQEKLPTKSPLWTVTSAFLYEDNFSEITLFDKIFCVTAISFLFFFGTYLLNSMSSDLIIYVEPPTIKSYADALDRVDQGFPLQVVLPPYLPETSKFKEEYEKNPNSAEGRLYNLRSNIFQDENTPIPQLLSKLTDPVIKLEAIVITRESIIESITAYTLNVFGNLDKFKSINGLLNVDPYSKKYTNVLVYGTSLNPIGKNKIQKT